MDFLKQLFSSGDFRPHGYCYLWNPGLVWLHVVSDVLIAIAYFSIPVTLVWFVRKRRDLPFSWMFGLFGLFIVACGTTHVMEVWNLWHANYWLAGVLKAVTAAASVPTAILLTRLVPQALDLPNVNQWVQQTASLEKDVRERRELELNLRTSESNYRDQAELLDLTHDAVMGRGLDGKIFYWNRGAERLYGWQKEEARGQITHELFQTQFPKPLVEIQAEVLEEGSWEGELVHTLHNGSVVTVSSRWALRTDPGGKPLAILESNRDITQRKREEEKFRKLIESVRDAIVIVNHVGEIHLVNAQTEKSFGYSREELIGKKIEILVPERLQAGHASHRNTYSQAPRPRKMGAGLELYGRRKDGSEFPVEVCLTPLETGEGMLISSAIRDITARKKAEKEFREIEQRFLILVDRVQDCAIIFLDPLGRVSAWNSGAERLKGYQPGEVIGRSFECFYLKEEVVRGKPAHELKVAASTGHFNDEGWRVRKDGSKFWANVIVTALRDPDGELLGFAKITRDITDRRRTEQEISDLNTDLKEKLAELVTLNKELESFSYSVSHDLRAPLRHIDGFARILKEEHAVGLSQEGHCYLDRVLQAANHMGHLIDDVLNLARIGRKELVRHKVKLDELIRQAMADLPSESETREIEWCIEPLPEVDCDAGLLKLVFSNLLSNAVKFTRTRQPARIEVGSREVDGRTALFVRDNGVGFDTKYADKLFGVFQRLHSQEEFEGTGVGLATVQRIIRRHGGEIWAESELGHGTTFFFTLDARPPQAVSQGTEEVAHGRI